MSQANQLVGLLDTWKRIQADIKVTDEARSHVNHYPVVESRLLESSEKIMLQAFWDTWTASKPRQVVHLHAMADWCMERDLHDDAYLYRWCAKMAKWPNHRYTTKSDDGVTRMVTKKYSWAWYYETNPGSEIPFNLPIPVYFCLRHSMIGNRFYASETMAMCQLRGALKRGRKAFQEL